MPIDRRQFVGGLLIAGTVPFDAFARTPQPSALEARFAGALWAMAIGDGMGAPVEGWEGARIRDKFGRHDFTTFLPPTDPKLVGTGRGKGDGRITDDMIMVEALIEGYARHRDHLDAHAYARHVIAPLADRKIWVPEKQDEITALDRPVWWPERYAYHALVINNHDPRTAGQGNWPQQGLMGMVMPTGAINAGDPRGAYDEVIAYGVAHQHSFALEAAAVTAALFAAAFGGEQSSVAIIAAGRALAKDGTAAAIDAVLATVDPRDDFARFEEKARKAYVPYFGLPPGQPTEGSTATNKLSGSNAGNPSRIAAVENLTAGLAAFVYGGGDFLRTMRAALFYGQDCESIAAFALGLLSASRGRYVVPPKLISASAAANRRNYDALASGFITVINDVRRKDADRLTKRPAR